MDFSKINDITNALNKATPIKDLDSTKSYLVLSFEKQRTRYGESIVANLEDGFIFLPKKTVKYLQENEEEYFHLKDAANKLKLVIQPQGGYRFKFELI